MTTCTRRRCEGPLAGDPQIARLLRVRLRLPRAIVEDIVRAQCYVEVWWYSDGLRDEIPFVRGKKHGTVRWWRADGSRECEIPYVNDEPHGTVTWWRADGSRESEIPYVDGKRHGTMRRWRADGSRLYEVPYANGKPHGKVTWWLADGTVWRTQLWQHGAPEMNTDLR